MAEATAGDTSSAEANQLEEAARQLDAARMKQIGGYHFAMATGALVLWGAAETWAQATGWGVAQLSTVAAALVAGTVLPSLIHEWGHFSGARLSGAASPVLEEPNRHFFMFNFDMSANSTEQFAKMSWGGILAPWALAALFALFVPLATLGAKVLLAMLLSKALAATVFELPVVRAAVESGEPGAELGKRVAEGGLVQGRNAGYVLGVASLALLWMAG